MKKGGFTLIEIMIVVAVIGLLAALAVPNFFKARAKTVANQCVNNLRLIQSAKDQYSFENAITSTVVPGEADIEIYMKNSVIPSEPTGSSYSINAINTNATCHSGLEGHAL